MVATRDDRIRSRSALSPYRDRDFTGIGTPRLGMPGPRPSSARRATVGRSHRRHVASKEKRPAPMGRHLPPDGRGFLAAFSEGITFGFDGPCDTCLFWAR